MVVKGQVFSGGRRLAVVLTALCLAAGTAVPGPAAALRPREEPVSLHSGFLPVALAGQANHRLEPELPAAAVTVNGVPFDLAAGAAGGNNVFLSGIGWGEWDQRPRNYEPYDYERQGAPHRWNFSLPRADYTAVHLLAYAEPDPAFSDVISFRLGTWGGGRRSRDDSQVFYHDFSAVVPRAGADGPGRVSGEGWPEYLYHVRVPLGRAIAQDLVGRQALDVDVTKELRLAVAAPDPYRFRVRPLGLPSGVHVLGLTFERAPVQMTVTSDAVGHVFNEPETPTFRVALEPGARPDRRGNLSMPTRVSLVATAVDFDGRETVFRQDDIELSPLRVSHPVTVDLPLMVPARGYHRLEVALELDGEVILRRETTFALLPPDTRRHRDESPFGVRENFAHFTVIDEHTRGTLMKKAGMRYAFRAAGFRGGEGTLTGLGLVEGQDPSVRSAEAVERLAEQVRRAGDDSWPRRIMIWHENRLSRDYHRRTPDLVTGWGPYPKNEAEQERLAEMIAESKAMSRAIAANFPQAEIYFNNSGLTMIEAYLRHGFPAGLMGSIGVQPIAFGRPPEAQPPDVNAANAHLWMARRLLDEYGYEETPLRLSCEAVFPGTNPGNLTTRTQAEYIARYMLHMLAWRIPIIRLAWLADAGNSYYFGNWAASGLLHGVPELNPKPAYVAFATTTLLLDGAEFTRIVPTGSPVVYAMEFARRDGSFVTVFWTPRGQRTVRLEEAGPAPVLVDMMANEHPLEPAADGGHELVAGTAPVFLRTAVALERAVAAPPAPEPSPAEATRLAALDDLAGWAVVNERDIELETYNYDGPRRRGDFAWETVAGFDGADACLRVQPRPVEEGSPYLPMYSSLVHREGIEIPGEPTAIGLMVHGNGGWGRVIFELEDAAGQRWISLGGETRGDEPPHWLQAHLGEAAAGMTSAGLNDANTNDRWNETSINFEGWRYLSFPLPGNYPGEGYHWPVSGQWRHDGDGVVQYPLRFRRLVVTMPEKIVFLDDYRAVTRPEIYLRDLAVTYRPVAEEHAAR